MIVSSASDRLWIITNLIKPKSKIQLMPQLSLNEDDLKSLSYLQDATTVIENEIKEANKTKLNIDIIFKQFKGDEGIEELFSFLATTQILLLLMVTTLVKVTIRF